MKLPLQGFEGFRLGEEVNHRLREIGLSIEALMDDKGSLVKFFEKGYTLVVRDIGPDQVDVKLVNMK